MSRRELAPAIPRPYLAPEEREAFISEISPIARRARKALNDALSQEPLGGIKITKKDALNATSTKSYIETQRGLAGAGTTSQSPTAERAQINVVDTSARVARLYVNEIIRRVNDTKIKAGVKKEAVPQEAASLVGREQINEASTSIAEGTPYSPPFAHQDTKLVIFEPKSIDPNLQEQVLTTTREAFPEDPSKIQTALAIAHLFSLNLKGEEAEFIPLGLRDPKVVSKGIVEVTKLVDRFTNNQLVIPTEAQLGKPTKSQPEFVKTYVDALTAYVVSEEIKNPNRTHREWQKFYLGLCREVSTRARRIGFDGKTLLADVLNKLPDVQAIIITARLSDSLMQAFQYPALMLAGERRIAQMLKNAPFIEEGRREEHVGILLEIISTRLEQGDINVPKILEHLNTLEYDVYIIEELWVYADENGRAILLEMMSTSPSLRSLYEEYQQKIERYEFADPEVQRATKGQSFLRGGWAHPKEEIEWATKYVERQQRKG